MKNKILLTAILYCVGILAFAQRTSIGITVGSGTTWMSNSGQHVVHKESCNVGAAFVYSTQTHWGLGIDVKYSREGYKHTYNGTLAYEGKKMDERVSSDFIRIPIRAIYFFNDNSHNVRPNISLGPSFGFLTGGKIRNEDDNTIYTKTPVKDAYNSFDFGIQGTIGLSFKLRETLWLSTDIAYYHGLIVQNTYGSNNMMNRNLVLNLGLRIGINK
ncbi:porin family protein [Cytophaga aurantiaca]|uniref:porin family protein n=1 Tax=Cytophaga aurantiaca TaxID=29530 RepID=UPI00036E938B|nr:porin family protein [Cytophaga aurantiaca]